MTETAVRSIQAIHAIHAIHATLASVALAGACLHCAPRGDPAQPIGGDPGPPLAARGAHVDRHHGQDVADPYRWLETDSEAAVRWRDAQDRYARRQLAALPRLARLEATVVAAAEARRTLAPQPAGDRRFFVQADASATTPSIYVEHDGRTRLLVDGRALAADDRRVHRQVWPSPDGRWLAYGVMATGARRFTLRVLDVDRGRHRPDEAVGLVAGRSSVSWVDGDAGLAYVRFDPPGSDPRAPLGPARVVTRRLGDADERVVLTARDERETLWHWTRTGHPAEIVVTRRDRDGRSNLEWVQNVLDAPARTELAGFAPGTHAYAGDLGEAIVVSTTAGAARGHVREVVPRAPGGPRWNTLIAETEDAIDTWAGVGGMAAVIEGRVVVVYRRNVDWVIRVHDPRGRITGTIELPTGTSMWSGLIADHTGRTAYVSLSGFADPGSAYRVDLATHQLVAWRGSELPYDPRAYVTEVVHYPRPGQTPAPMFLAHRHDLTADRARPVLVYGYGWGGWSAAPWFRPHTQAFMDAGGILALPILRGGGEYGEAWHRAGVRRNRPNAIADYLAACAWLASSPWSRPGQLIAEGQSAGGSLVAMAVLRRPALFGAQILAFPALDLLRYEQFTGAAAWTSEFGTVDDPDDFAVLRVTSPVQNVPPGRCHPPTLLLPGELDPITPPLHAYKYAAELAHAQRCDSPIWLRIARGAGHAYGADAPSTARSLAAQIAFALAMLAPDA